ncbi:D-cysteine desulfhydrase family protein [Rhizobium mesosinicum]|uniref:D-cysteine desulfhydrase family protein n=1 Tax=Rhizobium mesosinicum TaxID=335017 RepID=A0ABS7GMA2_9HYPH|nr:D-cysteine desulfhydrase family protein [Rhizobium mesosinicum]MBW9051108.1 D-cysteine desulfhydrase family protein [Rhizobium mesosinicum]
MPTSGNPFDIFPRVTLMEHATPIERLFRIEDALGADLRGTRIWAKRDDHMTLGGGGNKLRKLEFLLGQATNENCDTIIAVGGVQSNFARLAAAASARRGLSCELVLTQMVPNNSEAYQRSGNVMLDELFGATVHALPEGANTIEFIEKRVAELAAIKRKAFVATLGGSTPVGCLGYARCAFEIHRQSRDLGVEFDLTILPNGSGGTHAGLLAGAILLDQDPKSVRAHSVLGNAEKAIADTVSKVNATLELLHRPAALTANEVNLSDAHFGDGYGIPTRAMVDAVRLMARQEGLLLDPVYGGKAFAGLLTDIKSGIVSPGSNVLFLMTGGTPGLFAYRDAF